MTACQIGAPSDSFIYNTKSDPDRVHWSQYQDYNHPWVVEVAKAIITMKLKYNMFILSIANLILKPHRDDGFCNVYNSWMIIILIVINVLWIAFGIMKESNGAPDWYAVIEVCSAGPWRFIFQENLCRTKCWYANLEWDSYRERAKSWQPFILFVERYSIYR